MRKWVSSLEKKNAHHTPPQGGYSLQVLTEHPSPPAAKKCTPFTS